MFLAKAARIMFDKEITVNYDLSKNEIKAIRAALSAFNEAKVGPDGHTPLSLAEYDAVGNMIGGLVGGTYWGWLYIDVLWVHEAYRGQGIGKKLLLAAECEAKRRGCHHVHLDTMSWQAPAFYQKHGYEILGVLPDIPAGYQKYLLQKKL